MGNKTNRFEMLFSDEELSDLKRLAEHDGISLAEVIRRLITASAKRRKV